MAIRTLQKKVICVFLKLDPANQDALTGLASLKSSTSPVALVTPIALATASAAPPAGPEAEHNKQWKKAIDIYLETIKTDPKRIDLWLRIATIEYNLKNYPKVFDAYKHAIAIQPDNSELHQGLSQTYAEANQPQAALAEINAAVKIKPDNIDYLKARAILADWAGNSKMAEDSYQRILKLNPKNAIALLGLKKLKEREKLASTKAAPPLSPVDALIAKSNDLSSVHQYQQAANVMLQAIKLRPNDATLYNDLSEIYGTANQALPALDAENHALALDPFNLKYLRARAQLAGWAEKPDQALDSYARILRIVPGDQDAMLGLARTLSWLGKINAAIAAYHSYLMQYPTSTPDAWIEFAENLSWADDFRRSLSVLHKYQQQFGESEKYLKTKARILTGVRYYNSALAINNPLLSKNPKDPYLLITQVYAKAEENRILEAFRYLDRVNQVDPNSPQTKELDQIFPLPYRSNVNIGSDYDSASNTVKIAYTPVSYQYFLTPATSFLIEGLYANLHATNGSGLNTFNGQSSINAFSTMAGFTTQFASINLKALAGDAKIDGGYYNDFGIYNVTVDGNLGENIDAIFERSREIFQPYLTLPSPRSVSLGIMENRNATTIQWQPWAQDYINLYADYSTLSDDNAFWHLTPWPKARIFSSQYLLLTMGVQGDFWFFNKRLEDGYYSPLLFQQYEGTIEFYVPQSSNIGYSLLFGSGMQKDETFPHYFTADDASVGVVFGIISNWQLALNASGVLRGSPVGTYKEWSAGGTLTRRL